MYKETALKDAFLISTINISSTESRILLCNAKNEYGNVNYTSNFFMTGKIVLYFLICVLLILQLYYIVFIYKNIILDIPNGLVIKGPPIVVEGDYVTLLCGASKYYYLQYIKWTYQTLYQEEVLINNDSE